MMKRGALRQHLGPRGIPSFNGEGGGMGSEADTSSSDYGGRGDPSPAGYGGWGGGISGLAGDVFGRRGFAGTGYGVGMFGTGVGLATALGDVMGAIAAEHGVTVDEPSGVRGGDPNAFGGGSQGNDVGGAVDEYLRSEYFRPFVPNRDVSRYGKNPVLGELASSRFGFDGNVGGGRLMQHLRDTGQMADFEAWQSELPAYITNPQGYTRENLFADVTNPQTRQMAGYALNAGYTPAQARMMDMGALRRIASREGR